MNVFGLPLSPQYDIATFAAGSSSSYQTWFKPRGRSMCNIYCIGAGGAGGTGVVGAASTAAGGGGGGSGAQSIMNIPLMFLPDVLYIAVPPGPESGAGFSTTVAVQPSGIDHNIVCYAGSGAAGNNASGASAGTGGTAGGIMTVAGAPNWFQFGQFVAGQAGTNGGTTGAGVDLTVPATGVRTRGGTGGAGLGAGGSAGSAGGSVSGLPAFSQYPAQGGGLAPANSTSPPGNGSHGFMVMSAGRIFYPGTGGGSTHGSATAGGLVQSSGGSGSYGCGGGGMGGALTASTAGKVGRGGDGLVIITCW
jgi:hypothetical protein